MQKSWRETVHGAVYSYHCDCVGLIKIHCEKLFADRNKRYNFAWRSGARARIKCVPHECVCIVLAAIVLYAMATQFVLIYLAWLFCNVLSCQNVLKRKVASELRSCHIYLRLMGRIQSNGICVARAYGTHEWLSCTCRQSYKRK